MISERARFLRFLLTGGFAAGVNVASRILFNQVVALEVAVVLAYLCGMGTAFVLARAFVFHETKHETHAAGQFARFAVVNLVALAQVWLVTIGLARWAFPALGVIWHPDTLAHVIGVVSPIGTSYLGHKHFSFGRSRRTADL